MSRTMDNQTSRFVSKTPIPSLDLFEAVWFDAGDTLITIPENQKLFAAYLADHSFSVSEERIIEALNDAFTNVYYGWKTDSYTACSPESDRAYWVGFYRYVLEKLGLWASLDEALALRMCHELYELYISPDHYILFDDVIPALEALQAKGFKMAVVSNFAPTLPDILAAKGVERFFDPIVVSTLAGYEKPDPRIFQHTLEITGLDPAKVLYIGDHETNDLWAPAQVGIQAIRIKRYDYQQGEGIRSLLELVDAGAS